MKKYLLPILKSIGFLLFYGLLYMLFITIIRNGTRGNVAILHAFAALISSVLAAYIYIRKDKKSFKSIGISFENDKIGGLTKGISIGVKYSLLFIMLLIITMEASIFPLSIPGKNIFMDTALGIVVQFFGVALSEEIIFRGYLLKYLSNKYTTSGAVIVSSIIFALVQAFNPYATVLSTFNAFLLGCILDIIVLKYKNLWIAIGMHFSWNIIFGVILLTPIRGKENSGIFNLSFKNIELLNGGLYGVEGGLLFSLFLMLIMSYYLYKEKSYRDAKVKLSKKNKALVSIFAIITLLFLVFDIVTWIPREDVPDNMSVKVINKFQNVNNYDMDLTLDTSKKTLTGTENVSYINNSSDNLKEIYFHIYANAFKGFNGSINITKVKVDGNNADFQVQGRDETILYIPLVELIKPGERKNIYLEYTVYIPERNDSGFADRFAYGKNTFNLGNSFPIASVYENGAWDRHIYDKKGDAFYSETSNFNVRITAPYNEKIAAVGQINSIKKNGKTNIWSITARGVRDFAFVSSDKFKMVETNVDGTIVKSYAFNRYKALKSLNMSRDAIKTYNKIFGQYPYGTCSVVEADLGGGMEYPTLVMIEGSGYDNIKLSDLISSLFFNGPIGEMEFTVVHELAHQWWYGVVGNDEFREAWIDEPLAQYSSLLYYKYNYGDKIYNKVYNRSIASLYKISSLSSSSNPSLKRSLDKFQDFEYTSLIYYKGTIFLKNLNSTMGDKKFNEFL